MSQTRIELMYVCMQIILLLDCGKRYFVDKIMNQDKLGVYLFQRVISFFGKVLRD